jgi:hypothetical protein
VPISLMSSGLCVCGDALRPLSRLHSGYTPSQLPTIHPKVIRKQGSVVHGHFRTKRMQLQLLSYEFHSSVLPVFRLGIVKQSGILYVGESESFLNLEQEVVVGAILKQSRNCREKEGAVWDLGR